MEVLNGEARRLFMATAPGSKGAPSSQARALCYAKSLSQNQLPAPQPDTSTSLRTFRESSFHFIPLLHPSPDPTRQPPTHTHARPDNSFCRIPRTIQLLCLCARVCVENEREMRRLVCVCPKKKQKNTQLPWSTFIYVHFFIYNWQLKILR